MNTALAKKEFEDIISERLYIFAFIAQLVIVMGILYAALLYTSVAAPQTTTFVQTERPRLGVMGHDKEIIDQLQDELEIVPVSGEPLNIIELLDLVGVLSIKSESEFEVYLDNTNLLSGYADTVIDDALSKRSTELKMKALEEKMETADIVLSPISVENMAVGVQRTPERPPEFIVIMYGLLIPFILLLPTFLAANMVTDSIVGEKERKTYEVLVAAPLTKREIILSKTVPILLVTLVQSFIWILLLLFKDIPIYNIPLLMLLLLILDVIFIGIGVLISALSDTLKESNLTVTITIILASIVMFAPLTLKEGLYRTNPLNLLTKLASNPQVPMKDLVPMLPLAALALMTLFAGELMLKKRETLRL
jgi:ABC-2 type transport system permease protein